MGEIAPGVAVIAVVLADRTPLPLAEVGAPFLPGDLRLARLVQPFLLSDIHQRIHFCLRQPSMPFLRSSEAALDVCPPRWSSASGAGRRSGLVSGAGSSGNTRSSAWNTTTTKANVVRALAAGWTPSRPESSRVHRGAPFVRRVNHATIKTAAPLARACHPLRAVCLRFRVAEARLVLGWLWVECEERTPTSDSTPSTCALSFCMPRPLFHRPVALDRSPASPRVASAGADRTSRSSTGREPYCSFTRNCERRFWDQHPSLCTLHDGRSMPEEMTEMRSAFTPCATR